MKAYDFKQGLNLRMKALMNDTEATLLSHAFANPSTKISLILGTGLNAALPLPISALSEQKLGKRPKEWMKATRLVLVNAEISMFGHETFPLSKADKELDATSVHPGFQPLEQLTSGRYLGEICRLVVVDGIKSGILFSGKIPGRLEVKFGLDTALMAELEVYVSIGILNSLLTSSQPASREGRSVSLACVSILSQAFRA